MKAFFAQNRWNAALYVLAACVLLPTCWYRFGIDQSLYEYVGCGMLHGYLPYRDGFDIKSPGVFFAYALASVFFGCGQVGIRIFESLLVLSTGWAVGRAVSGERRVDGVAGASALLLGAFHAFSFGFWDTAEADFWEGAFLTFAFVVSAPKQREWWRDVASGALAGTAVVFKVPAAIGVFVLFARYSTVRAPSGRVDWRAAARFAGGVTLPMLLVAFYFAVHGATRFLWEWALYLRHYAAAPLDADWTTWLGPEMLFSPLGPWLGLFGVPIAVGLARGRERNSVVGVPARPRGRSDDRPSASLLQLSRQRSRSVARAVRGVRPHAGLLMERRGDVLGTRLRRPGDVPGRAPLDGK